MSSMRCGWAQLLLMLCSIVFSGRTFRFCGNECNDGGCGVWDEKGKLERCDCDVPNSIQRTRTGDGCDQYEDACKKAKNLCKNDGQCLSVMGRPTCDCPAGFGGGFCQHLHGTDKSYPKKWRFYHRTKVRPGETIRTMFVMDITDKKSFSLTVKLPAVKKFDTHALNYETDIKSAEDVYDDCKTLLNSNHFKVYYRMCDDIKNNYGSSDVTVFRFSIYIPKTNVDRTNVYFNGAKHNGRMGGLYTNLLTGTYENQDQLFNTELKHLVVDDEYSYCLPFVDPGESCTLNKQGEQTLISRGEDKGIKIVITPDVELCKFSFNYTFNWIVNISYQKEDLDPLSFKFDHRIASKQDLFIPKYTLPLLRGYKSLMTAVIELNVIDVNKVLTKPQVPNKYMCMFEYSLLDLHVEIIGSPEIVVNVNHLVTLDASSSHNPNEPNDQQDHIEYVWRCNVKSDHRNCNTYITKDPIRTLTAPLDLKSQYIFDLVMRPDSHYKATVGEPKEAKTSIKVIPRSFGFTMSIKCIKNCETVSSSLDILYLVVETGCKKCTFEWSYKEKAQSVFSSALSISTPKTPSYVLIVKKSSLDFQKTYTFKATETKTLLACYTTIKTAARPELGECHLNTIKITAGESLFNIECLGFRDEYGHLSLRYDCYQSYDGDQSGLGVLLGDIKDDKIRLSFTGPLTIRAVNKYGIYTDHRIAVQVTKGNVENLADGFEKLKKKALTTSEIVQMVSFMSDMLLENNIPDKFTALLKTIQRVSSEGCMVCIEQSALILHKVAQACSKVNGGRMKSEDLLEMSASLSQTANDLFKFLKTHNKKTRTIEVERIERSLQQDNPLIFKGLESVISALNILISVEGGENVVDVIISNENPKNNKGDEQNLPRYYWTSLQNLADTTQNVEDTLKVFGESITLHHFLYENEKRYDSTESRLWANVFDAESLENGIDLIDGKLADELFSKSHTWGVKIFELNRNLTIWANEDRGMVSTIKYAALSGHGEFIKKEYLGLIRHLDSPASIHFNLTGTLNDTLVEHTIRVPVAGAKQILFDKAVRVFRVDMKEIGSFVLKIETSANDLLITWLRNKRPDFETMSDYRYVRNISAGKTHKMSFKTAKEHLNDVHYLGVFVNTTKVNRSTEVTFRMSMVCMRCLRWSNSMWSPEGMEVGPQSDVKGHMHCLTRHLSMFSSEIFVMPTIPNPVEDFYLFSTISDNMVCLVLIVALFTIYAVLMIFSRIWDVTDIYRARITVLNDNYPEEDEVYLVVVYTGHRPGSGTTANVCIELQGSKYNSRPHWLYSMHYRTMQRSNDDWFLIFTPQSLGEIRSIRVWHDNGGSDPEWYCSRIMVIEVRGNNSTEFEIEQWFSLIRHSKSIEYVFNPGPRSFKWKRQARELFEMTVREKHMWASVFLRHPRSLFTRCQRLSLIFCTMLSIMTASMLFYSLLHTDEEKFGTFKLQLREVFIGVQSEFIELVFTFGVHVSFEKAAKITFRKVVPEFPQANSNQQEDNTKNKKSWIRNQQILIAKRVARPIYYYPANTETPIVQRRWNVWLIIGWCLCLLLFAFTGFYIILFGLKFGRVKSLCWLTAILIGSIQSVLVTKPFNIVFSSLFVAKYNDSNENPMLSKFLINLRRYRRKMKPLSQDPSYLMCIRSIRLRSIYTPLSIEKAIVSSNRQLRMAEYNNSQTNSFFCIVLILLSVCYLCLLDAFGSQTIHHYANQMVSKNIEYIFNTSINDAITPKILKTILSDKLLKSLHTLELYNGVVLIEDPPDTIRHENVGWFSLYNSRLIGAGIRLRQTRFNWNGTKDEGTYKPGWIEYAAKNETTIPWMYNRKYSKHKLFFETIRTDYSGFKLDLVGGLTNCKRILNEHLHLQWLDDRTKEFFVEFHVYNAGIDTVTAVKIILSSVSGLYYKVKTEVHTIPMLSVLVTWETYTYTLLIVLLFSGVVVCQLAFLYWEISRFELPLFWIVYDTTMAVVIVFCVTALIERLDAMENLTKSFEPGASKQPLYDDFQVPCQAHSIAVVTAAALAAMSALRMLKLPTRRGPLRIVKFAVGQAKTQVATVVTWAALTVAGATVAYCAFFSWDLSSLIDVVLNGGGRMFNTAVPLPVKCIVSVALLLFDATVVAIFVKYHRLHRN